MSKPDLNINGRPAYHSHMASCTSLQCKGECVPAYDAAHPPVGVMKDANPKQAFGDRKVALQHVPPTAEIYLALAMQDGARKYGPFNWRLTKVEAMTYVGAIRRHLNAWVDGEECAADSGYPHLAHAMACFAILADAVENDCLLDNRPPKGASARLLAKWEKPK